MNTGWTDYKTTKPPNDSAVLVYLSASSLGTRFAILRTSKTGIKIINGIFLWDLAPIEILCWKPLDEFGQDLPLKYEGEAT